MEFELKGANPNQQYTVGAYLFNPNNTADYPNINQFLGWFVDKATITVEHAQSIESHIGNRPKNIFS